MRPIEVMRMGSVAPEVTLNAMNCDDIALDPQNASASVTFDKNGQVSMSGSSVSPGNYRWLTAGSASSCEVKVDVTSGTFSGGSATGVWHNMGTSRVWTVEETVLGEVETVIATVQIRNKNTLAVLAGPVQFDFSAEVQ